MRFFWNGGYGSSAPRYFADFLLELEPQCGAKYSGLSLANRLGAELERPKHHGGQVDGKPSCCAPHYVAGSPLNPGSGRARGGVPLNPDGS